MLQHIGLIMLCFACAPQAWASHAERAVAAKPSTAEVYAISPTASEKFMPDDPYFESRQGLDYRYHNYYSLERQTLQNTIISTYLSEGQASPTPTLIFTAGPMGSGKTHTMKNPRLQRYITIRYRDYLHLDPDKIKYMLPEMTAYIKEDRSSAGTRVHKESGFIQEIVFAEALKASKNLIVDGSFKDKAWHEQLIQNIRLKHPHYRLGLIYVTASPALIAARLEKRYQSTGRYITLEQALRFQHDIQASVVRLQPAFDFALWLQNDQTLKSLPFPATADLL